MKKILLLLSLGISSAFAENNHGFLYQGEPINPACVAMFNSSEADFPYISSINLNVCQRSNAAFKKTMQNKNVYYFYNNGKNIDDGSYGYKVVGKSKNNIYVLGTSSSGGGTLVATDLLLVKLVKSNQYVYDGPQLKINKITEMKLLGYVMGGDRCVGAFANVQIVNNNLKIKQFNDANAGGECKKTRKYAINLSGLNRL